MRNLIVALMASVATVISFGAANAADAVDTVPQAPAPTNNYVPASDWSGAYLGATGSYNWGHVDNSGRANAFGLGAYGGYNMQDGQLVYGVEGNIDYSGAQHTDAAGVKSKEGVNGALRARLGVDMSPFMIYGAGGIAASDMKVSNAAGSDSRALVGWTAGVGAETKLTDNVTARIEYDYTDFGKRNFNLGGTTVSRGYDSNSVKIGIGYKF